jgi:hypothetical protein
LPIPDEVTPDELTETPEFAPFDASTPETFAPAPDDAVVAAVAG